MRLGKFYRGTDGWLGGLWSDIGLKYISIEEHPWRQQYRRDVASIAVDAAFRLAFLSNWQSSSPIAATVSGLIEGEARCCGWWLSVMNLSG